MRQSPRKRTTRSRPASRLSSTPASGSQPSATRHAGRACPSPWPSPSTRGVFGKEGAVPARISSGTAAPIVAWCLGRPAASEAETGLSLSRAARSSRRPHGGGRGTSGTRGRTSGAPRGRPSTCGAVVASSATQPSPRTASTSSAVGGGRHSLTFTRLGRGGGWLRTTSWSSTASTPRPPSQAWASARRGAPASSAITQPTTAAP